MQVSEINAHLSAPLSKEANAEELLRRPEMTYALITTLSPFAPGMIESKMVKKVSRTVVREITSSIPLRRLGKCEEVANTVVYLSSAAASYIVGQTIVIDGGLVMR